MSVPSAATLGILGGGQLGRLIGIEAKRLGYRTIVLDPTPSSPAGQVCDEQIIAEVADETSAMELARRSDILTLEWELIPAPVLEKVRALKPVFPGPEVLAVVQDRLVQREWLKKRGFPQTSFIKVDGPQDIAVFPSILKRRRHGYDGKGQARLNCREDVPPGLLDAPCLLEGFVAFEKEISVILARTKNGEMSAFPVAENVHKNGILHTTVAPARIGGDIARRAEELACDVAEALGHVGVLCVEMFIHSGGRLLINEIAPRVHNSGHYTLGACETSQFEQHVRAVCGLELGSTRQLCPAVMVNLLGDLWAGGEPRWQRLAQHPSVTLHLYGKTKAAPGRKMGHLLILGQKPEKALALADGLLAELRAAARV